MTKAGGSRLIDGSPFQKLKWTGDMTNLERRQAIAAINDEYRLNLAESGCGEVFMSKGIQSILMQMPTYEFLLEHMRLIDIVATFEHGDSATDGDKRDFGLFSWRDEQCCWKFDYLDKHFSGLSRDPANVSVTRRVVTIMLLVEFGRIDAPAL